MRRHPSRFPASFSPQPDLGLLVLRLGAGLMLAFGHGLAKLTTFPEKAASFADPIGLGPTVSLALVVFAELFCALAVAVGLLTRLATLPVLFTMGVAAVAVHGSDGFKGMEKALLFGVLYLVVMLTGPGKYSLDYWLLSRRPSKE
jgi:putative oxidoreductase